MPEVHPLASRVRMGEVDISRWIPINLPPSTAPAARVTSRILREIAPATRQIAQTTMRAQDLSTLVRGGVESTYFDEAEPQERSGDPSFGISVPSCSSLWSPIFW
jgi:hypothetical protein